MEQKRIAYLLFQASFPDCSGEQLNTILDELVAAIGKHDPPDTQPRRRDHRERGRRDKAALHERDRMAERHHQTHEAERDADSNELTELFWQTRTANPKMMIFLYPAVVRLCGERVDGKRAVIDWIHLGRKDEA